MKKSYHRDPRNLTWSEMNDQLDLLKVIEIELPHLQLKKRGTNYVACCPFHDERSASFSVSMVKNIWKCFGCGKGGNAVSIIWEVLSAKGYTGKDIASYIKEKYNLN